jgi:chromosome segregation protein
VYLRRLEIAGFKSFGDRVRLELEPGVSAIVGPNGSGKSNIAEAIRWVLGERAGRSLRTAKTEDLIFSGTEKGRAKASLAEVSLVLSGRVGEGLDYEELKISRKLYRSGESEYRLNGRKCLARDLAKILAQAGFGTSSYTVIGQGMVDNLIIASPAERKLLFEEASGIRGFELERADVLVRLRQAQEQAQKLRNEALELVPERDRISQDVDRLGRRREVASELKLAQQYFLQQEIMRVGDAQKQLNKDRSELEKEIIKLDLAEKGLQSQAQKLADNSQQSTQNQADLIQALADLDSKRSQLSGQITQAQVELELKKAELNSKNSQSQQVKNKTKLQANLKALQKDLQGQTQKSDVLTEKITQFDNKIRDLTKQLAKLRQALRNNQRAAYIGQALGLARLIARQLTEDKAISSSQLRILLHKLIRTVKLAHDSDLADAPDKIAKLQQQAAREMAKKEEVVEKQTTIIIRIRSLELDIHAIEKELESNQLELPSKLEEELLQRIKVQEEKLTKLCAERDRYEVEQEKLRSKLAKLSRQDTIQAQVEIAHQLEEVVQQGKMKQEDRSRIDARREDLEHELKQLSQQAKTWRVEIGDRVKTIGERVNRDTITRLEAELTLIGEIDEAVIVVYGQLQERIAYLEDQAQDIERAIADLEKVLDELTRRIQSTFAKNFARINRSFAKHFAQLFSGGTAELTLLQLDDDYGIEITVQPPGKRVATLSALSGGEKALSAIALLSAILSVNPSPFIVLDEVDAALDDRNAQLFCQTLKQLAKKSQILVITHNHETMVQSDKLFGVTASPRTASTVLAVELAEAEAVG